MLKRGLILRSTANGESAIYQTKKFEHEVAEVKRVEALVLNTLNSVEYASEFIVRDKSFCPGKPNTQLRIPFQIYDDPDKENELNKFIVQRLKEYSWLSLSPDYIVKVSDSPSLAKGKTITDVELEEVLDPETKKGYTDDFEKYQKDVISVFNEFVSKANENLNEKVHELSTSIHGILLLLNKYVEKESELNELLGKYADLSKQLGTLINELAKKASNSSNLPPESVRTESTQSVDAQSGEDAKDDSEQKGGKWKRISIAGGALLLVTCYACFLHPHIFEGELVIDGTDTTSAQTVLEVSSVEVESEIMERPNLEELVAQFNTSIQEDKFADAYRLYNQVVEVDANKTRELDRVLEERFNALIADCKFSLANQMLKNCLCEVYENTTLNERELTDAFRSHIKANKKDISQKIKLISQINSAKQNGYGYDDIEEDLAFISALTAASQQKVYSLYVYKDAGNTPVKYSSNDTIKLDVNVVYRIRVKDIVNGAKLSISQVQSDRYQAWDGKETDLFYNKYKGHMVLLKSEKYEEYTEFDYKKDNNVLCKIKVKFVNSSPLSRRGFRRLN